MRWLIIVVLSLTMSGCSIYMNKDYKQLVADTSNWSTETADRATAGKLSDKEMITALKDSSILWDKIALAAGAK